MYHFSGCDVCWEQWLLIWRGFLTRINHWNTSLSPIHSSHVLYQECLHQNCLQHLLWRMILMPLLSHINIGSYQWLLQLSQLTLMLWLKTLVYSSSVGIEWLIATNLHFSSCTAGILISVQQLRCRMQREYRAFCLFSSATSDSITGTYSCYARWEGDGEARGGRACLGGQNG